MWPVSYPLSTSLKSTAFTERFEVKSGSLVYESDFFFTLPNGADGRALLAPLGHWQGRLRHGRGAVLGHLFLRVQLRRGALPAAAAKLRVLLVLLHVLVALGAVRPAVPAHARADAARARAPSRARVGAEGERAPLTAPSGVAYAHAVRACAVARAAVRAAPVRAVVAAEAIRAQARPFEASAVPRAVVGAGDLRAIVALEARGALALAVDAQPLAVALARARPELARGAAPAFAAVAHSVGEDAVQRALGAHIFL